MVEPAARSFLPIVLHDLVFRVGDDIIIRHLSASIELSGITAIIGANGAGKSVCLRLVDGLLRPTSGTITFGLCKSDDIRRAFVFQQPALIRASVELNVALALKAMRLSQADIRRRVDCALAAVGLTARAKTAAGHLSGGEAQRLAMARAMVANPHLLLLDEPTASLDPGATEEVERLILAVARGGTKVILVSHNLGQVSRLAQDVLVLSQGRVVEHGPTRQVLTAPRHPAAIAYLQGELPWPPAPSS